MILSPEIEFLLFELVHSIHGRSGLDERTVTAALDPALAVLE
jgi:hypothetical protein